jgi:NIMA-interacting peptidyl-prolyl cis-trans isomerase 1
MRSTTGLSLLPLLPLLALAASLAAGGCGGSPSSGAASPAATPGARCLAEAEAKHSPKGKEGDRITVKHVLVRYQGARGASPAITRTREEACLRAEEALSKLQGGAPFGEVVAAYSDESGAATREGSLGAIERTDVLPAFADAAFELKMAEVSQVVETAFGFHVILRTE